jgi:energy-coupling factor transporter transmembrane protein EcfT
MTVTAIRFPARRAGRGGHRRHGARLRGLRLWTSPFAALRPLFFTNIRRATVLADSIESRAFSRRWRRAAGDL